MMHLDRAADAMVLISQRCQILHMHSACMQKHPPGVIQSVPIIRVHEFTSDAEVSLAREGGGVACLNTRSSKCRSFRAIPYSPPVSCSTRVTS